MKKWLCETRSNPRLAPALFSEGLYEFLYGDEGLDVKFDRWCEVVASLPRKQTRVLTWPLVTVFGFIAQPQTHFFLKPNVTRLGAREYGYDLQYASRPSWEIYSGLLKFAATVRRDLRDLRPRDMIDIQSFIWVQGSDDTKSEIARSSPVPPSILDLPMLIAGGES